MYSTYYQVEVNHKVYIDSKVGKIKAALGSTMLESFFIYGPLPPKVEVGTYQIPLVILSYLVATFASYTALALAQQILVTQSTAARRMFHWGGAFAMGAGVWSMHFIGMLSYKMDMAVQYDPWLTLLSMLIAIAVAYGVLGIVARKRLFASQVINGAILLGFGICSMHYVGMEAMKMGAELRYIPSIFSASVAIAIGASGAALWLAFTLARSSSAYAYISRVAAAMVMGAAICGMHYTGMMASVFVPYADCRYDPNQSFSVLALAIAATTVVVLGLALAAGIYNRLQTEVRLKQALNESEQKLFQAQKMEAIGNLTGGMAHDFNNLLSVMIGNLDLLMEKAEDKSEIKQLAQEALDSALRGADLTRRLLAFARQQPLQPQRVNVNQLIDSINKLLSRTLGENIRISLTLEPDIWSITIDQAQLEAALTNLATNARDAMPDGGQLLITTRNCHLDKDYVAQYPEVAAGDYVAIEVSDTGAGIPADIINRIFEPFFTTKERGRGTGLGLAMVFGFMKQSGGHVSVYSEPGKGTTFRLYLPRVLGDISGVDSTKMTNVKVSRGQEVVLVVEDNESVRRIVVRQLNELGYSTLEAQDAESALKRLEGGEKIDLMFTDIVMPGRMNGIELAHKSLDRWPKLKVILTSGFPENKINGHGKHVTGGLRLLSKPYRKDDLARLIREVLDGSRKRT